MFQCKQRSVIIEIEKGRRKREMLNYEKYREIQTDLLQLLRCEEDKEKATERYCQENNLIIFEGFIFDDWKNTIVLRLINDVAAGVQLHLVELPFEMELHRKLKEGKGKINGR